MDRRWPGSLTLCVSCTHTNPAQTHLCKHTFAHTLLNMPTELEMGGRGGRAHTGGCPPSLQAPSGLPRALFPALWWSRPPRSPYQQLSPPQSAPFQLSLTPHKFARPCPGLEIPMPLSHLPSRPPPAHPCSPWTPSLLPASNSPVSTSSATRLSSSCLLPACCHQDCPGRQGYPR